MWYVYMLRLAPAEPLLPTNTVLLLWAVNFKLWPASLRHDSPTSCFRGACLTSLGVRSQPSSQYQPRPICSFRHCYMKEPICLPSSYLNHQHQHWRKTSCLPEDAQTGADLRYKAAGIGAIWGLKVRGTGADLRSQGAVIWDWSKVYGMLLLNGTLFVNLHPMWKMLLTPSSISPFVAPLLFPRNRILTADRLYSWSCHLPKEKSTYYLCTQKLKWSLSHKKVHSYHRM